MLELANMTQDFMKNIRNNKKVSIIIKKKKKKKKRKAAGYAQNC